MDALGYLITGFIGGVLVGCFGILIVLVTTSRHSDED